MGLSFFYDYDLLGEGRHNQGIYRVNDNFTKEDLLVLTCLLNSQIYRRIFDYLSIGAKMGEIKIYQLIKLPFPKFPQQIKKKIAEIYQNILKISYKISILKLNLKEKIDDFLI